MLTKKYFLLLLVLPTLLLVGGVIILFGDLPNKDIQRVEVYAAGGELIAGYGGSTGHYTRFNEMPESLIHAVLATEDRNFFSHNGIDVKGIVRAALANYEAGEIVQGGSTITQQLAKNIYLTSERSYSRKFYEAVYAIRLERNYTKEAIFEKYMNHVYLGGGYYGVDAAARGYFKKNVDELEVHESALIAGLLQAPSRYSPVSAREQAINRAQAVLGKMNEAGFIKPDQKELSIAALDNMDEFKRDTARDALGWFAHWVKAKAIRATDKATNIKVYTTLDMPAHYTGYDSLSKAVVRHGNSRGFSQAALVTLDTKGRIISMIGGHDYRNSPYNRVVDAKRSPGSAFKPVAYLSAIQQGAHPNNVVFDEPINIRGYRPANYNNRFQGDMLLREALMKSVNTVAVKLGQEYGNYNTVLLAQSLGVTSPIDAYASLPLGSAEMSLLELANIYAHFSSDGARVEPYAIEKITNEEDDVLYEHVQPEPEQIVEKAHLHLLNGMLRDVVSSGTGTAASFGRPVAGKTGTSQSYRDAIFAGYTPQYATVVWLGNDDNTPMHRVTGGSIPARIFASHMRGLHQGKPVKIIPSNLNPLGLAREERAKGLPWLAQDEMFEGEIQEQKEQVQPPIKQRYQRHRRGGYMHFQSDGDSQYYATNFRPDS